MSCRRVAAKLRLRRNVPDMIAELVIAGKRSRPLWQGELIVQFSDLADQAAPEDVLRHHVVALERFWSNTRFTNVQGDASETGGSIHAVSPVQRRRRITARVRAEAIEHYERRMGSRRVAATLGLGRTTVLEILKAADLEIRPHGRKY